MKKFDRPKPLTVNGALLEGSDSYCAIYNQLRKISQGKVFRNYEMMLFLAKTLDTFRNMNVLKVFVDNKLLIRKKGLYSFPERPVYKTRIETAYQQLRA